MELHDIGQELLFLARVFSDALPKRADLVYLVSETEDNQASVLKRGLSIYRSIVAPVIGIFGIGPGVGYPGREVWEAELAEMGCRHPTIIPLRSDATPNTFTEARSLVAVAKKEGWSKVVIVAPAFHLLRAFVSFVSAALLDYPELKIYPQLGEGLPWDENVVHSQGTTRGKRSELFLGELYRIAQYRDKGDLVPRREVLAYLERRDRS